MGLDRIQRRWSNLNCKWSAKNTLNSSVRSRNTVNKNIKKHFFNSVKWGQLLAISWLLYTNLQNKTLCLLVCTNLQNKHDRRVTLFARSQKSQHKYIVSKRMEKECSGWKKIEKLITGRDVYHKSRYQISS